MSRIYVDRWGCLGRHPHPGADTPSSPSRHPQEQTPPSRSRHTPWEHRQPPSRRRPPWEQCMLGDTGNKRAVRILLECMLVTNLHARMVTMAVLHNRLAKYDHQQVTQNYSFCTFPDPTDHNLSFFTVRNVVAERLRFHRHLSFCSRGVYPSMHWGRHPRGKHPPRQTPTPGQTPPPPVDNPPPRRPLQRMVGILLECLLVDKLSWIPDPPFSMKINLPFLELGIP